MTNNLCPTCEQTIIKDSKFCGNCGSAIPNDHFDFQPYDENKFSRKFLGYRISKADSSSLHPDELKSQVNLLIAEKNKLEEILSQKKQELANKEQQIVVTDDALLIQSYGLYTPQYKFKTSERYKKQLDKERDIQKQIIRDKRAVTGQTNWTVNDSKAEGKKLVNDVMKLLLRSFNNECEEATNKVRYSNFAQSKKRIDQAYEQIIRLGRVFNMSISTEYYQSKIRELHIAFEYAQKKEEEKEALKLLREERRENAKLKKEIEEAKRKLLKEQTHYQTSLSNLIAQLENAPL